MVDRFAGLIPLDASNLAPPSNMHQYPVGRTPSQFSRQSLYAPMTDDESLRAPSRQVFDRPGVQYDTRLVKDFNKAPQTKKVRKTSIEGETIPEIVNNIIKEKTASLKLVNKAFQNMVDILEDERDELDFMLT